MSVKHFPITIADAATESDSVQTGDRLVSGFYFPSGWTTADVTFQGSYDDSTFFDIYNEAGSEMSIASVAASRFYAVDPATFAGVDYIRLVTSVAQAGGDSVHVATRRND